MAPSVEAHDGVGELHAYPDTPSLDEVATDWQMPHTYQVEDHRTPTTAGGRKGYLEVRLLDY